jgi:BirA family biotin operon repressor/biotin-[acetyl-CoA-carboxylase] ligase
LAPDATSVSEAAGRPIDRNSFTATYLNTLEKWFDVYRVSGPARVLQAWREHDLLAGRWITVRDDLAGCEGRALGANHEGQLVVQDAWGEQHRVIAGEIVVRD